MATPSVFKQPGEAQNISIFDAIDSLRQNLIKVHNKLEKYSEDLEGGDISYALSFIRLLKIKLELSKILLKSYMKRDQSGLANVRKMIPEVIASIKAFDISFRQMWLRHNKPFGLEVIQIRNAGLVRRFEELDMRIEEFLENKIDTIPEIDEVVTSLNSIAGKKSKCEQVEYPFIHNYKDYATSSFIL
jgi:hypothetical protein